MKRGIILLIFGLLFQLSVSAQILWQPIQASYKYKVRPITAHITSDGTLYASGSNNMIYFSKDNGFTWEQTPNLIIDGFNQLTKLKSDFFSDIFAISNNGQYLSILTAGAKQWKIFSLDSYYRSLACISSNGDFFIKTLNSAIQYSRLNDYSDALLTSFDAETRISAILNNNQNKTFIFTNKGLYANLDTADKWKVINDSVRTNEFVAADSSGNIFAFKSSNNMLFSSDSGRNWNSKNLTSFHEISDFFYDNGGKIFFVASNDVSWSNDNGKTWTKQILPTVSVSSFSANSYGEQVYIEEDEINYKKDRFLYSSDKGETWVDKTILAPIKEISGIIQKDSLFFLSLLNGGMCLSNDECKSFSLFSSVGGGGLISFAITDSNDYIMVVKNSGIFKKLHDGTKWNSISNGLNYDVNCLQLISNDAIIVGTRNGGIYYTSNGGLSWTKSKMDTGFANVNVFLRTSDGTIYSQITEMGILKSTDNGYRWVNVSHFSIGKKFNSMAFNNGFIYACPDSDGVYQSSDYGANWQKVYGGQDSIHCYNLLALKNKIVLFIKDSTDILLTSDNCKVWNTINEGLPQTKVTCVMEGEKGFLYLSTMNDGLFKSQNPLAVSQTLNFTNELFISPNPAKEKIKIEYSGISEIKIIDVLGNIVLRKNISSSDSMSEIDISNLNQSQ